MAHSRARLKTTAFQSRTAHSQGRWRAFEMRLSILIIIALLSIPSFGQTTISKEDLLSLLTTPDDSKESELDIDFPIWETDNSDSAFYKSDTILLYRNADTIWSKGAWEKVEWNFSKAPFMFIESKGFRKVYGSSSGSGAILMPGETVKEVQLEIEITDNGNHLTLSVKTPDFDWISYELVSIDLRPNTFANDLSVTILTLKKIK